MKETAKPGVKICPVCEGQYPQEDNYCGVDGSRLEQAEPRGALQMPAKARPSGS
jgi:hypothetical protein